MTRKIPVNQLVNRIIQLRAGGKYISLLAVCPNSDAVLEAAIKVAVENNMPMLFAATMNQVDRDGGYTGWTPEAFVHRMEELATRHACQVPLYPCLDHGGPWLKDNHTRLGLSLEETMEEVKKTLSACLAAGYDLLHIDPTVDRKLPKNQPPDITTVVERTIELIAFSEAERERLGLFPISYEVGTEEVHGGLVDFGNFGRFLDKLQHDLKVRGLMKSWPCFIVGKVGTDLHTTSFDPQTARRLYEHVSRLGSLIKGHYTDWVSNPEQYPLSGMGGANVGPEFTATELDALYGLCLEEANITPSPSNFKEAIKSAVLDSNRWQKWLLPDEEGLSFASFKPERQDWLIRTGARYVWTDARVVTARQTLYTNLKTAYPDPHSVVVNRIAERVQKYVEAFNLKEACQFLCYSEKVS
jgi:tagatose-1,6-bisphosphate aldolase non-catalytic subunit AgaZ/GatZ